MGRIMTEHYVGRVIRNHKEIFQTCSFFNINPSKSETYNIARRFKDADAYILYGPTGQILCKYNYSSDSWEDIPSDKWILDSEYLWGVKNE